MATRILLDPRQDLPDASLGPAPVLVEATPTGIREDGSIVVLPTTVSFVVNTAADIIELTAPTVSWAWVIEIRRIAGQARIVGQGIQAGSVLARRTVTWTDAVQIAWADLTDLDPTTLQPTTDAVASWTATQALAQQVKASFDALVAGAPSALDTFLEVANQLTSDESGAAALAALVATKAPIASPTFTGTVAGVSKSMVGLGSVDNTADTAKPVSTAQAAALALKADAAAVAATYSTGITVASKGATGDGVTDDHDAIQAAIDSAATFGSRVIVGPGTYSHSSAFEPRSGVTISGVGSPTFSASYAGVGIVNTAALSNFTVEGIRFLGKSVMPASEVPTRNRTTSGSGYTLAIDIRGSLAAAAAGWETAPAVSNITIRNCVFENTTDLPIRIFGVAGYVSLTGSRFRNTKDVGFGYNETLTVIGNTSYMSADNGFSISRGNHDVTFTGNVVKKAAYAGIWFSGWITGGVSYLGPDQFSVTGNVVDECGWHGIAMLDAPKHGVISGNTLYGGYHRGPIDGADDFKSVGIRIVGTPSTNPAAPTDYAQDMLVANNQIRGFATSGIGIDDLQRGVITSNQIYDIGTLNATSGNPILATSNVQNIGILIGNPTFSTDLIVTHNHISDTRSTPLMNYGIYPASTPAVTRYGNTTKGARSEADYTPVLAGLAGLVAQGKTTSRYYSAPPAGGVDVTLTANTLYLVPMKLPEGGSIARLAVRAPAAAAGGTVQLGLYNTDPTTQAPTTLIAQTTALPTDAAGVYEGSIAGTQVAGPYWLAVVAQGVNVTVNGCPSLAAQLWLGMIKSDSAATNILQAQPAAYRVTGVTGALPATLSGLVGATGDQPRIAWRWA